MNYGLLKQLEYMVNLWQKLITLAKSHVFFFNLNYAVSVTCYWYFWFYSLPNNDYSITQSILHLFPFYLFPFFLAAAFCFFFARSFSSRFLRLASANGFETALKKESIRACGLRLAA